MKFHLVVPIVVLGLAAAMPLSAQSAEAWSPRSAPSIQASTNAKWINWANKGMGIKEEIPSWANYRVTLIIKRAGKDVVVERHFTTSEPTVSSNQVMLDQEVKRRDLPNGRSQNWTAIKLVRAQSIEIFVQELVRVIDVEQKPKK
ncbi:MAG: hypothetical protein K0S20_597 [Patescibacteria group bacterium]|jgi:hypothetical protein|nr:hypothetical protein [Patescibacteria group bacterium]